MVQPALIPLGIPGIQGMLAPHPHPNSMGRASGIKDTEIPAVLTQEFPGASPGALGVPVAAGDRKT